MNPLILILRGQKPKLINVTDGQKSLNWRLSDGSETELEIMTANVASISGDSACYLIATDMDDLDSRQIRQAVESLTLS